MITPANNLNYNHSQTLGYNNTQRKVTIMLTVYWSLVSVIAVIAAIALGSLALALAGMGGLAISILSGMIALKTESIRFHTVTGGNPNTTPLVRPLTPEEKSPLSSDSNLDLSIVVEHPSDELNEVRDALLQEGDPISSGVVTASDDKVGTPIVPALALPASPAPAEKKAGWSLFSKKEKPA